MVEEAVSYNELDYISVSAVWGGSRRQVGGYPRLWLQGWQQQGGMFVWGFLSPRSILDCESLRWRVLEALLSNALCWCLACCVSTRAAEHLLTFTHGARSSALLHHPLSSVLLPYPVMYDTGWAGSADGDVGVHQSEEAVPARHCRCGSYRVSGHRQPLMSSKVLQSVEGPLDVGAGEADKGLPP